MRQYLNRLTSYQSEFRDKYIDYQGILATIEIPTSEDELDSFGDIRKDIPRITSEIKVIPRYDIYHQVINLLGGADIEQDLPLELIVKDSDYIPNDSLITLPICRPNDSGTSDERWKVISSEIKYLENMYTRLVKCVPHREQEPV
jgi:hypothetical protein